MSALLCSKYHGDLWEFFVSDFDEQIYLPG